MELKMSDVIAHYDALVDEGNDPVRDPAPLREYMDKWDGQTFIDKMELDKSRSALEIGVGTGRLAARVAPLCKRLAGIDISPKTIERARKNLSAHTNISLICADFMSHEFDESFDVVYSSLTFMHIGDKRTAIEKIASLLSFSGVFALSLDKSQSEFIDMGTRKIRIFPDNPDAIKKNILASGLCITEELETEFANIIISKKISRI